MHASNQDQMAILLTGLRHADKERRAGCVHEIVQIGCETVPELIRLLDDPDWKVRYRAAEALGMIQDGRSISDLIDTCSDEKDHVRYMAAKALGCFRTADAVPVLIQLLFDEHPYTRGIAAEGLAATGDIKGKTAIQSALEREKEPGIRDRMRNSLNYLK